MQIVDLLLGGKLNEFWACILEDIKNAQKREGWEFSGGPMVRTPRSYCQGPGFDAVVGELSTHKSHSMVKRKKKPTTKKPYKKWGGGLKVNNIKRK